MNISSAIVYARPGTDASVRQRLPAIAGVEVHAASEDGRLVVTIEAENDRGAMDIYEAIARLDDVLNIAMIFQQTETHPDQELAKCK
ncbi:MAG: chaperone NapD [Proteobacteria bacterium]|nr:chaperone NapD [Pseudomonadota bacterium]